MLGYGRVSLLRMGVGMLTGGVVKECADDGVVLSDGRKVECCSIVWAAGVRATPAAAWLNARADRAGRIVVDECLRVSPHRTIFAIGDIAASQSNGKQVPGLAPAAK